MNWIRRLIIFLIAVATVILVQPTHSFAADNALGRNLFEDAQDAEGGPTSQGFALSGDAMFGRLNYPKYEINGRGARLPTSPHAARDGTPHGAVTTIVRNLRPQDGRWFRMRVRGMAQDDFKVADINDLFMKVEFFRDNGKNPLDHIIKPIYGSIIAERKTLADAGTNKKFGKAVWRSFDLEFRTPFPEVDTLALSVESDHGKGVGESSEFWMIEMELTPIPVPADYAAPKAGPVTRGKEAAAEMVSLGGRWYYDPRGGDRTPPTEFNHTNADRFFYLSDRLETPFQDNMSAWARAGYLDIAGNELAEDKFEPGNVTVSFTKTHLIMHTKCLPNHPTAVFPDRANALDGNPNFIQEKNAIFSIPLDPKENPQHIAMKAASNENGALPRGPIGIAVNGIVFFNPFDQGGVNAIGRLDRCCGHPSPNYMYHYHKYPVCVKSPWADDGESHSPLIGFAFDGYPIYGPYESKGLLAKDDRDHPLNEFNIHFDEQRGWHYHVTPGQFPHIIGGYWGVAEIRRRNGPPPGG